jgi:predicted methyltransferase
MHRMTPLFALIFAIAACQGQEPQDEASDPAAEVGEVTADHADEPQEPSEEVEEIPNRESEVERDTGSRPQEMMDFVGIGQGSVVADILAGGGYNAYLLSQRVGPTGTVYAQGYRPGLEARLERGDLATADNVVLVEELEEIPEGALDAILIVRAYHLFENSSEFLASLHRSLKPGGTVGVVEVRLGQERGHEMSTHRMGELTVIDEFEAGGFEYVGESDILRNPEDDHTEFWEGRRHLTDRMLLKFARPVE